MRIIGGKFKGKKLFFLSSKITRPLRDMVKESIINIIVHSNVINVDIKNSNILDLYSGVGSFGIECLSREAKEVTFVEENKNTFQILKKNITNLLLENNTHPNNMTVDSFLSQNINKKYDILFFDPPYANNDFLQHLKIIKEMSLYKQNNLVIIHREREKEDNLPVYFNKLLTKSYGKSKILFGHFT
tara:strand:+ start:429 stop:989 length:561 start_codon:yes stop_codon:yes gene_type:complete